MNAGSNYAFDPLSCGQLSDWFDCVVDVVFVFEDFELPPLAAMATPVPVRPRATTAVTRAKLRFSRNT